MSDQTACSHPPIPEDCPHFEETADGWMFEKGDLSYKLIDKLDDNADYWRQIIAAVAFFYHTRNAQRNKRAAEAALAAGDIATSMGLHAKHVEDIQYAIGWAKWSGL